MRPRHEERNAVAIEELLDQDVGCFLSPRSDLRAEELAEFCQDRRRKVERNIPEEIAEVIRGEILGALRSVRRVERHDERVAGHDGRIAVKMTDNIFRCRLCTL